MWLHGEGAVGPAAGCVSGVGYWRLLLRLSPQSVIEVSVQTLSLHSARSVMLKSNDQIIILGYVVP